MGYALRFTLIAVALLAVDAAGVASAQAGLARERAGIGIKSGPPAPELLVFGGEAAAAWLGGRTSDYSLYAGAREQPRLGLSETGAYGGIVQPISGSFGSSLEAGYVQGSLLAPRRYMVTGQLHTEFRYGRALSLGLQYRVYDGDLSTRAVAPGDMSSLNGYSLASSRLYGAGYTPGYQLQLGYQHSPASTFGLAFGREVETTTPYLDSAGQRQLTFTGQHWLTPSWALSYDLLTYDLASPLRPLNLRLGVGMRYRF